MIKIYTFSFLLLISSVLMPQWSKIEPLPIKYDLNSVFFINNEIGYAASQYGIILKTTDGGNRWKTMGTVAENKINSIFMLADAYGFAVGEGGVIIRTYSDSISIFDTWIKQNSGVNNNLNSVYFSNNNVGYIAGDQGIILKTVDGGLKWNKQTSGTSSKLNSIIFINETLGWAAGNTNDNGIMLKSTNSGKNWVVQSGITNIPGLNSIIFINKDIGWAVGNKGLIVKTTNGGDKWIKQNSGSNFSLTSVKFINEDKGIITGEKGVILITTNGGSNWEVKSSGTESNLNTVAINPLGNIWAMGNNGSILQSNDFGNNWSKEKWVVDFTFKDIFFTDVDTGWIIGGPGFIFKTTDAGNSWNQQLSNTGYWLNAVQFIDSKNGWIVGKSGLEDEYNYSAGPNLIVVLKTTDGGVNWQLSKLPPAGEKYNLYGATSINFVDNENGWISGYVTEQSFPEVYPEGVIYKTTNSGKTWVCSFVDNTNKVGKVKYQNREVGWCIDGFEYESGGELLKTTDSGSSWYVVNSDLQYTNDFVFIGQQKGWLSGVDWEFQKVIITTNDGGETWERSEFPFSYTPSSIYFIDQNTGWAVGKEENFMPEGQSSELILYTKDGGRTWRKQSSGAFNPLKKVFFSNKRNGLAVGENGMIMKYHSNYNEDLSWVSFFEFCNSEGICLKLNFGQNETATNGINPQLGEDELSPVISPDVLDARFLLPVNPVISTIQDYRNVNETSIIWNISFQVGAGGYPVSMDFHDLPEGNFQLVDDRTGNILVEDLNQNPYLVIENSSITSVKLVYSRDELCKDITYKEGWNLISIPVHVEDMSLSSLLPLSNSKALGFTGKFVETDTLIAGRAYYVKLKSTGKAQFCGNKITSPVEVKKGWNLIGPFDEEIPVNNITTTPDGILMTGFLELKNGFSKVSHLRPGKGYFVKVKSDGYLNFNTTNFKSNQQLTTIKENWGKIIIEDQKGNAVSLYDITDNEINSEQFELPPLPPAGILDARYESGSMAEDLFEDSKRIYISSGDYPVKFRSEGSSIKLKYVVNGKTIEVVVKSGEEFLIKEYGVKSVEVKRTSDTQLPADYALFQNYPNPFNPETTIRFALPEQQNVNISVYSILGEKITELLNKELEPGYHEIKFNADILASGIYFYRIETDSYNEIKKMVVLK